MEYIGNCPKCLHHTIVKAVKRIESSTRRPQRMAKCVNCGLTSRITLIGEVIKDAVNTKMVNPEFATANRLVVHLWS